MCVWKCANGHLNFENLCKGAQQNDNNLEGDGTFFDWRSQCQE
jgi:hypothetical protein